MDKEQSYVIDVETGLETERLLRLEETTTEAMLGVFPSDFSLSGNKRILDIACGPGGWGRRVAKEYPNCEVIGVDINSTMIAYANQYSAVEGLTNVDFQTMSVLNPFPFVDGLFDIVNARMISGFVTPQNIRPLLREVYRILRPRGIFRWTEAEVGGTSSPAYELYTRYVAQSFYLSGRSFSPDGYRLGIQPEMLPLLREQGLSILRKDAYPVEGSFGSSGYESGLQDLRLLLRNLHPFLMQWKVASGEELHQLYDQVFTEFRSESYSSLSFFFSAWGKKPDDF